MATKQMQFDPDVKVGIEHDIIEGSIRVVTFAEPFKHLPRVFLTVNDEIARHCHIQAGYFSTAGFVIHVNKTQDGPAALRSVAWLAVDYELG